MVTERVVDNDLTVMVPPLSREEQTAMLTLFLDEAARRASAGRSGGSLTTNLITVLRETGSGLLVLTATEEWPEDREVVGGDS